MVRGKCKTKPSVNEKSPASSKVGKQDDDTGPTSLEDADKKHEESLGCECTDKKKLTALSKGFIFAYVLVYVGVIYTFGYAYAIDFVAVTIVGVVFSAIELASRYRDDPASVVKSSPGRLYLVINGLICITGLYLVLVFRIGYQVDDYLDATAQRVADVIQSSLASFFIMRSSFLRLGQNNEWDLGLNAVLKKLLHIVDREVDRRRAVTRSKDIVKMFKNLPIEYTEFVFLFCLQTMQNVELDEIKEINMDIKDLAGSEEFKTPEAKKTQQLGIGLRIYSIVGKEVLEAAVEDVCEFINPDQSQTSPDSSDDLSEIKTEIVFDTN
ncbi:TPA: hypothetical protein ACGF34_003202 [Vibrio cholerae]|nr:hypothetical protein [Vibrio cholerae]EGR2064014.1 hypothetical protein [Vibrio cholerae]EGR2244125.1 hypothetical protein [Vibrio cholerae]